MSPSTPTAKPPHALPVVGNATSQPYWDAVRDRGRLELVRCDNCGHWIHYPKSRCSECWSESVSWQPVSGQGTLVSWTTTWRATAPQLIDMVPFTLGLVELVEQKALRVAAWLWQIEDVQLQLDLPLEVSMLDLPSGRLPVFILDRKGR